MFLPAAQIYCDIRGHDCNVLCENRIHAKDLSGQKIKGVYTVMKACMVDASFNNILT